MVRKQKADPKLLGIAQDISTSLTRLAGEVERDESQSWIEVGRLLQLAKQHSQELIAALGGLGVRLSLAQVVLDEFESLRAAVPLHITLRIGPLDRNAFVKCEPGLLPRVLQRLVDNAVARVGELPGWIHVEVRKVDERAVLLITDCGSGVPERAFEVYGGALVQENEPGVGTSCEFSLPQSV